MAVRRSCYFGVFIVSQSLRLGPQSVNCTEELYCGWFVLPAFQKTTPAASELVRLCATAVLRSLCLFCVGMFVCVLAWLSVSAAAADARVL